MGFRGDGGWKRRQARGVLAAAAVLVAGLAGQAATSPATVSRDTAPSTPPAIVLPTWGSSYAWPAGDGYAGWRTDVDGTSDGAYRFFRNLGDTPGLWLWPAGGREYGPAEAEWLLRAPGTTRVARVDLTLAHPNKLFAHHCLRTGLREADGDARDVRVFCSPPAKPATQTRHALRLFDPSGRPTAKELFVQLAIPACKTGTPESCDKWIPVKAPLEDGAFVHVKDADLTLVDDDDPVVRPSKGFWELDGTYIDGKQTYPLRVDVADAGAGVTRIDVDHTGWPGPQPPLMRRASECDVDHHTKRLRARNCTRDDAVELDVATPPMPEGTRRFRAHTRDVAGNVGDSRWTVIIDRTPPEPPNALRFTTPEEGSGQAAWQTAGDPVLPDGTPGSGVEHYEARWSIDGGAWSSWDRMDDAARLSEEQFDHPSGTRIAFEVRAIDAVGNVGDAARVDGSVFGSAPHVTASERLADLRGDYVGSEHASVRITADDDGVGVRRVWLERAGAEIRTADAGCTPRSRPDGRPWKALCPGTSAPRFEVDTAELPEGRNDFAARAVDRARNVAHGDRWHVLVDHTGPAASAAHALDDYDEDGGIATITWDGGADPSLPTGEPGSGVERNEVRHRVGDAWSAWREVEEDVAEIGGVIAGSTVDVETRSFDAVGNASPVTGGSFRADVGDGDDADFPVGTAEGADAAITVVVRASDGEIVPVGGLPVTIWNAQGGHSTVLTDEDGIAYHRGLKTGEHRAHVAQAGGVTTISDERLWFNEGELARHRIELRLEGTAIAARTRRPVARAAGVELPSGVTDALHCIANIPVKICGQFFGDAMRATYVGEVLFGTGVIPDSTRANAFKHSYAVARFTYTMLTKYRDKGPIHWGYDFARGHEFKDREDPRISVRRASFMDTNNNLVGYNWVRDHQSRSALQHCSTMRTKSRNATYARYADGADSIAVPPNHLRTRLIFNVPYSASLDGSGNPLDAQWFQAFKPCKHAHAEYERVRF